MSVEQYGARLLGEVQEESLDEVSLLEIIPLHSSNLAALRPTTTTVKETDRYVPKLLKELRATIDPTPNGILGFPQVDHLLEVFRYHQRHSAAQHRGWPEGLEANDDDVYDYEESHFDIQIPQAVPKSRPPIIEVTSAKSAAGKTTLLYYLTALALLPVQHGGRDSLALWLDTSNAFSAIRLSQIITHILTSDSSANPQPLSDPSSIESTLGISLRNLFVLKPNSTPSLLFTLNSLPKHLFTDPRFTSQPRPLGLLILDPANAFSHQDRSAADIARLEAGPNATATSSTSPSRTAQVITALRAFQTQFECTIIFTTTHTLSSSTAHHSTTPQIPMQPPPLSPWTAFATLSLLTSRIPIPAFPPHATIEECLRDREKRQAAVSKGRFSVRVNWEGGESWGVGVRDEVRKIGGIGGREGFVLRIVGAGVDIE